MVGENLSLSYSFGSKEDEDRFDISLYCTDSVHALEKVSGGKCRIMQSAPLPTSSEVVCAINGGDEA